MQTPRKASDRQEVYLRKAAQMALRSNISQRHGCLIVDSHTGEILSTGYNHVCTRMCHKFSMHAECDALRKVKKDFDLAFAEMYVVRIGPESLGNPLRMSQPCEECARLILRANVGRVFYSWSDMQFNAKNKNNYAYLYDKNLSYQ